MGGYLGGYYVNVLKVLLNAIAIIAYFFGFSQNLKNNNIQRCPSRLHQNLHL